MISIEAIHVAPVKSLGLAHPTSVNVGLRGILEDRRLYLIDQRDRLLTQRELGRMVQLKAEYRAEPESLRVDFPGGESMEGPLAPGELVTTMIWGRHVRGRVATGDWNSALSTFCGQPVRLVRSEEPCQCYDEYPISVLSQASLCLLGQQQDSQVAIGSERFRPNFLLAGCQPHEEDGWLGGVLQVGPELRLRMVARDPRCAITTISPTTGERDMDTLRLILSYRPSARAAYFGVYGIVERPGAVSVGDTVTAHL